VVSSTPRPHFTPGKTRHPFYRRLGGPQGRSRRAENLVPTGIEFYLYLYLYVGGRTSQKGGSFCVLRGNHNSHSSSNIRAIKLWLLAPDTHTKCTHNFKKENHEVSTWRPRHRWNAYVEMYLKGMGCDNLDSTMNR